MPTKDFNDGQTLKSIREDHLNPTILKANTNEAKITGLQAVAYRQSFINASVDATLNKINFINSEGAVIKDIDLTAMLNQYQHGLDIGKMGEAMYMQQHSMVFDGNVTVGKSGKDVLVTIPGVTGHVGSDARLVKNIFLGGDTTGSSISADGTLTINLAPAAGSAQIKGQIEGMPSTSNIDTVYIAGNVGGSTIRNNTLNIELPSPEPLGVRLNQADSYSNVEFITLTGNKGASTISAKELKLELPYQSAQIGLGPIQNYHKIKVLGIGDSDVSNDVLTLDIPGHLTVKEAGNPDFAKTTDITFENATVTEVVAGKVLVKHHLTKGRIGTGTVHDDIKGLTVYGNIGRSEWDTNNEMKVEIPFLKAGVTTAAPAVDITGINFKGKPGAAEINKGILTINIPEGGGGTGTIMGEVLGGGPAEAINKIYVAGVVGTSTVANDVLTIDLAAGGGGGALDVTLDKSPNPETGKITEIEIQGDVETSGIVGNKLTLQIPHNQGVNLKEVGGTAYYTAVQNIEYNYSHINFDAKTHTATITPLIAKVSTKEGETPKEVTEVLIRGYSKGNEIIGNSATINIPEVQAQMGDDATSRGELELVKLTGSIGASTFHNGILTIDMQTGGGGAGGDITGVVGSDSASINRVQVIGDLKGSVVDGATKTLRVNVNPKASISDTTQTLDDIDIVQVAHSTVELDTTSVAGKRKAVITPQVVMFFRGWFKDLADLEKDVPIAQRIPTKTCAYIISDTLGKEQLVMWMPPSPPSQPNLHWKVIRNIGAMTLWDKSVEQAPILSVEKNEMVQVDTDGKMTITNTTVPEVLIDISDNAGTPILNKGKVTKFIYEDGDGTTDYDSNRKELTLHRPQRRLDMGDVPDTKNPDWLLPKYEGSIWLNKKDHTWWGYHNTLDTSKDPKWTRLLHKGMSGEVTGLSSRMPSTIPNLPDIPKGDDHLLWRTSGWTHMEKDNESLPSPIQHVDGGFIQTFASIDDDTSLDVRMQVLYLDNDIAGYKRDYNTTTRKWEDWVKFSFNPAELKKHNEDVEAHKKTHPFYQVFGIGVKYSNLAAAIKGPEFKHVLENEKEIGLIASSGAPYAKDSTGVEVPYKGKYNIRGLAYIGGKSDIANISTNGEWVIDLQRCESSSNIFNTIYTLKYQHHSTTLKYPPFSFDFKNVDLEDGDFLRLKIEFKPTGSTEDAFIAKYPELWIMPGRSFFSVDVEGQDTGYCIGKNMGRFHGGFSPLTGGAFGMQEGAWPNDKGIIVGDGIETAVEAGI